MKKKLAFLFIFLIPITILAIGSSKREINLPGFTTNRVLFNNSSGILDDTDITVGGSDNELTGINSLQAGNVQISGNTVTTTDTNGDLILSADGAGRLRGTSVYRAEGGIFMPGQAGIRFYEILDNDYIELSAPDSISSSFTLKLPDADGSSNQCIKTNGSGELSFGNCISSAGAVTVESQTANFTASTSRMYLVDMSLATVTATLPAASGVSGESIEFKLVNANSDTFTIDGNASETIDGLTTWELRSDDEALVIRSDGSNWQIVSAKYNEVVTTTSSAFALSTAGFATGEYAQMTGNSVTLGPAKWDCDGFYEIEDAGTNPDLTRQRYVWSQANGANTSTQPTLFTVSSGINAAQTRCDFTAATECYMRVSKITFTLTSSDDLFLVPQINFNTAGDGQAVMTITCERID